MLLKPRTRNKLFDRLHFTGVSILMGITVFASANLIYFGYTYYTKLKPQRKLEELKLINEGKLDEDVAKIL